MTLGVGEVFSDSSSVKSVSNKSVMRNHNQPRKTVGVMGSRRIFAAAFKLKVLDSYRSDIECRGNQRATARKYGIHRRQIQKWLQCEKNLRNTCAENTNGMVGKSVPSGSSVSGNGINIMNKVKSKTDESTEVAKSSGTASRVPMAAASVSALNLSLARLHGDELTTRQGPSPHPILHRGSLTSAQYTQQTPASPLPIHALLIGYTEYSGRDLHNHQGHQLPQNCSQDNGISGYEIDRASSPIDDKYYVVSHSAYSQSTSGNRCRNDTQLYHQSQQASYVVNPSRGYNSTANNDPQILESIIHPSSSHVPPTPARLSTSSSSSSYSHLRDADSPGSGSLAPEIKTERASPDSPATSVSCDEAPSSPGITTTTSSVYPVSQHTYRPVSAITTQAVTTANVPFVTLSRTDSEAHVHVYIDAYMPVHSENKEQHNKLVYAKREDGKEIPIMNDMQDVCMPTEQIGREQENHAISVDKDESNYNEDVGYNTSAVSLFQSNSKICPGSLSLMKEPSFSDPSSPKGSASISSTSASSCSEGELDPMDYSSRHQNSSRDSSRRRSFSLRFKLDVLDAFHKDTIVARNQRATARKFGINRRQVQKWLGQETELRGEIALRGGDLRQRLGPLQELAESAIDLRTGSTRCNAIEMESTHYRCDLSSRKLKYKSIHGNSEVSQNICTLSCCTDNSRTSSITSYYSQSKRTCQPESQESYYCFSPKDPDDILTRDNIEINSSPSKRTICNCCYDAPFPKRLCAKTTYLECNREACQDQPTQETPLCLVKAKYSSMLTPLQPERITSTVHTPPAAAIPASASKKDAILFKPYLDNPVSKPTEETHQAYRHCDFPTLSSQQNVIIYNNNCSNICHLTEERGHQYAVELSLRVPVSWRAPSHIAEFPERFRSAFARYPATPHYI